MADISKVKLPDGSTYDIKDSTARSDASGKVSKSGDTMTGKLKLKANQYSDSYSGGSLDLQNSNIDGVNSIYTADASDNAQEGIHFYRDSTHVDSLYAKNGYLYFSPNRKLGENGTPKPVYFEGTSVHEADLVWGGRNFSASYGPIDAAMIPDLGANRFAFLKPAGIAVEYSNDGGSTWLDYELSDANKTAIFANGGSVYLGKHSTNGSSLIGDQLRITISTGAAAVYSTLNKFAIYMSTNGNTVQVKMEVANEATPNDYTTLVDWTGIAGWSGWNILNTSGVTTYGNTASSQKGRVRFIFRQTAATTTYSAAGIWRIMAFGGVGWTTPSNMAKSGHLYSYDYAQNATFPAKVTATEVGASKIETGSASDSYFQSQKFRGQGDANTYYHAVDFGYGGHDQVDFYEYGGVFNFHKHTGSAISSGDTLLGSINSNGWDGKVNGHTISADVPSDAKFTDTVALESMTGTLPVTHGGTGKTTANDAANNLISGLPAWTADPTDNTYFVRQDTGGTSTFGRVKFSTLWNYIKGKFSGTSPITFSNGAIGINTASTSAYGATKLSTATNSTAVDVAATPSAVKTAYDLANTANGTANTALSGVNGNLIYDQTFTISNGVATFTPHVYQKGAEVTTNYAASCFKWKYRLIDGSEVNLTTNSNRGCTVTISGMGYGGHVIGIFTPS